MSPQNSASQFKTEGLILRITRFKESDRFIRVLTPSGEVIELMARNVGRSRKRFAGGLEPLSWQRFEVTRRRSTAVVDQAEHVDDFLALREDLKRFYLACYGAERAMAAAPAEGLFQLMISLLRELDGTPPDVLALRCSFDLKLLSLSGLAPRLESCCSCSRPLLQMAAALDTGGGGFRCSEHEEIDAVRYLPAVRALLQSLTEQSFDRIQRLRFSAPQRIGVRSCVDHLMRVHLPGAVRSLPLLAPYL